jgi:hypothetical protein
LAVWRCVAKPVLATCAALAGVPRALVARRAPTAAERWAQREIEKAVRQALAEGRLKGNETFPARATVTLGGIGFSHEINGEIDLG